MRKPISRKIGGSLALLVALLGCQSADRTVQRLERFASATSGKTFDSLPELEANLKKADLRYKLGHEPNSSVVDAPKDSKVKWDSRRGIYYLLIDQESGRKIYRFKIYPTGNGFYVEDDFAMKNPYQ